jgi:hypothetical protein
MLLRTTLKTWRTDMVASSIGAPGLDASVPLGPSIDGLAQAGVKFVGRYIASRTTKPEKIVTPSEAVELAIAGIALFPIYEGIQPSSSGATQGNSDGSYAATYLPTIGLSPDTGVVVYYAQDIDVDAAAINGIAAAFKAFGAALPGYGIGSYSCGFCNSQLYQQGLISKKWLSQSADYNGTKSARQQKDYDIIQEMPANVTINNYDVPIDPNNLGPDNPDTGARVPWGGAIPENAPLSVLAVQMLLNRAGQIPPLVTDGESGPRTNAAIITSKKRFGLPPDTSVDWSRWVPQLCNAAGVQVLGQSPAMAAAAPADGSVI